MGFPWPGGPAEDFLSGPIEGRNNRTDETLPPGMALRQSGVCTLLDVIEKQARDMDPAETARVFLSNTGR